MYINAFVPDLLINNPSATPSPLSWSFTYICPEPPAGPNTFKAFVVVVPLALIFPLAVMCPVNLCISVIVLPKEESPIVVISRI